jgi:LEA14-like dessication related protein
MNSFSRRSFLGVVTAGSLGGCATTAKESPVEILLSNLAPGSGGGVGDLALRFVIRLENASPDPVVVDGGSYKIELNGIYVGQGLSNERIEIPRLSSTTVTVPVHVSTVRLMGSLYQVLQSNRVCYRLDGTLYVVRGGSSRRYRTSREGQVDFASGLR